MAPSGVCSSIVSVFIVSSRWCGRGRGSAVDVYNCMPSVRQGVVRVNEPHAPHVRLRGGHRRPRRADVAGTDAGGRLTTRPGTSLAERHDWSWDEDDPPPDATRSLASLLER